MFTTTRTTTPMYKTGREAADSLAAHDRTKGGNRAPTLDFFVSLLLILFIVYKISFVPETAMQVLKCLSIALLILLHGRAMRHFDHFWAVVLLALVQPVCTLLAGETLMNGAYALVNGLCLISMLLTFKSLSMSFGSFKVADSFFWLLLAVSMANDISVFLSPLHRAETEYVLGNKFITGYTHMLLIGLYAVLLSRKSGYVRYNWGLFWVLLVESAIVVTTADTMTATIGLVIVAAMAVLLPKTAAKVLSIGVVAAAVLVAINVIFFATGMLLDNPYVQHFVTEILGRSLNLTGRTQIYDNLGFIVQMSPYVGWGYGSPVVSEVVGYGNAQNGIMELLVRYGIVGTVGFLLVIIVLLPTLKSSAPIKDSGFVKGCVGVLYGMFVVSLVEIPFGGTVFYLMISFISVMLKPDATLALSPIESRPEMPGWNPRDLVQLRRRTTSKRFVKWSGRFRPEKPMRHVEGELGEVISQH